MYMSDCTFAMSDCISQMLETHFGFMKLSVRLACIIHDIQGAKKFDIFCCGKGKSHIDARTGGDARTGP